MWLLLACRSDGLNKTPSRSILSSLHISSVLTQFNAVNDPLSLHLLHLSHSLRHYLSCLNLIASQLRSTIQSLFQSTDPSTSSLATTPNTPINEKSSCLSSN
jgi:hypothetical protein